MNINISKKPSIAALENVIGQHDVPLTFRPDGWLEVTVENIVYAMNLEGQVTGNESFSVPFSDFQKAWKSTGRKLVPILIERPGITVGSDYHPWPSKSTIPSFVFPQEKVMSGPLAELMTAYAKIIAYKTPVEAFTRVSHALNGKLSVMSTDGQLVSYRELVVAQFGPIPPFSVSIDHVGMVRKALEGRGTTVEVFIEEGNIFYQTENAIVMVPIEEALPELVPQKEGQRHSTSIEEIQKFSSQNPVGEVALHLSNNALTCVSETGDTVLVSASAMVEEEWSIVVDASKFRKALNMLSGSRLVFFLDDYGPIRILRMRTFENVAFFVSLVAREVK
jgi:hypothetical protein